MIYTIYNPNTFDVLFAQEFEVQPPNSTDVVMTGNFVKPKFNPQINEYYEGATSQEVANADPRRSPDYYLVRELAGKALVNEVATELLLKYKSGELTLIQVMEIEQNLDNTMSALGRGQIISALYHINLANGIDSVFKSSIASRIQALKVAHYA